MNNKGYTIIELLISAAILSFLIAGMVIMLLQQQRQFNFTKEISDIDTTGRTLLNFIASQIRNSGARQGKAFSLKFINGGSDPGNLCIQTSTQDLIPNNNTGTVDSPPDCIALYTWDLTAGMTNGNDGINLPSTTETTLFYVYNGSTELIINLPESYFVGNTFIGKTYQSNQDGNDEDEEVKNEENPPPPPRDILLGFRSRTMLCNPNIELQHQCGSNPKLCSECAMIFRASLNTAERKANAYEVVEHNFPNSLFINATFDSYISGIEGPVEIGQNFGFIPSIAKTPLEFNIIQSKYFRIDTLTRGMEMAQNLGNYTIIAGGNDGDNAGNTLETPGIVDLQFVFNLQNPDGSTSRVGKCNFSEDPAEVVCNDETAGVFSDFNQVETKGREQDIRSVDINLVLKSKIKPQKQAGGFYEQRIPPIADVGERIAPKPDGSDDDGQSEFNEPQNGFIYRVFSTTVYLRNFAREEQI